MAFSSRLHNATIDPNLMLQQRAMTSDQPNQPARTDQNDILRPSDDPTASRYTPGLILFAGGAALTLFTSALTRRALVRRYKLARPSFYRSNNAPQPKANGLPDALEALTVATLNVCSWATMLAGGWMWSLQVRNLEDLRVRMRSKIGGGARPGTKSKQEVEEEIEEWVAKILARKAEKDRQKREGKERARSGD